MVEVLWSPTAKGHLFAIQDFIAGSSIASAERVSDSIVDRVAQLMAFPGSGRMVPEFDTPAVREVVEPPYRIIYRVEPARVVVLAVVHGRRALEVSGVPFSA